MSAAAEVMSEQIREWGRQHGRPAELGDFYAHAPGLPTPNDAARQFGSVQRAIEAAVSEVTDTEIEHDSQEILHSFRATRADGAKVEYEVAEQRDSTATDYINETGRDYRLTYRIIYVTDNGRHRVELPMKFKHENETVEAAKSLARCQVLR